MLLRWKTKRRMLCSIFALLLSISPYSNAQENDNLFSVDVVEESAEDLFGASLQIQYVGPNMWAGFQLSNGPCIQPILTFSVHDFSIGMFMNFYGSERDRDVNSTSDDIIEGKYKKGLGMCDEVQLFFDWGHDWKWFSLSSSLWYMAYTWDYAMASDASQSTAICKWFGILSSGELTVTPAVNLDPFSIYMEHSWVVIAKKRTLKQDSLSGNIRKTDIGAYHGVFGITWTKSPVEQCSIDLGVKTEWATKKFLDPWMGNRLKEELKKENKMPHGFYHVTFGAASTFDINSQLSITGEFNVQFITNHWLKINDIKIAKGCIPYGGFAINYSFGW